MNHSFNVELAREYGIEEAILIENIAFWLRKNMTNNKNYIAGNYWVYNSYKSFNELFPYINPKKIQRVLVKLEKLNVIKSGSFNKRSYDRTKWYTIVSIKIKKLYNLITSNDFISKDNLSNGCSQNVQCTGTNCPMDISKMSNGRGQSVQPIPDIKPVIKTTTVQESKLDRPLDEQKIKDSGGYLDFRKKEIRAIKEKLNDSNLQLLTCKNIMKVILTKKISFERFLEVFNFVKMNNKSSGFIVSALRDNYVLKTEIKSKDSNIRSRIIDDEIIASRKKLDKERKEIEKEVNRKKVMDDYFNSLPKEKQRNIMKEAYAKAKKEYGCIWEVMGRTKVKYEILKKYKLKYLEFS
ncbi:hypothetical protein [Fusobacterium sp. MFO224]|uniref:hypothetical protein n=1 Tax=Fusobacterium sp. MFO224 TaxID=3378070 RepID=UPI003853BC40